MWSEARHQKIRMLLQRHGRITTEDAIGELGVSRETVRRDFLALEALGLLQRVHGGAVYLSDEPPIDKRNTIHIAAKQAITMAGPCEPGDIMHCPSFIIEPLAAARGA